MMLTMCHTRDVEVSILFMLYAEILTFCVVLIIVKSPPILSLESSFYFPLLLFLGDLTSLSKYVRLSSFSIMLKIGSKSM